MAPQRVATPSLAGTHACMCPITYVSGHSMPDETITNLSAHSSGSSVCQIVIDIENSACPGSREQWPGLSCGHIDDNNNNNNNNRSIY